MIEYKNINSGDRRHISGQFNSIKFHKILDLCLYGIQNDYDLSHYVCEVGSDSKLYNFKLVLSEYCGYYINIDYYEKTDFYDIEFSYKVDDVEICRDSLKTHNLEVVLSCINEISKLVNRSLND